MIRVLLIAVALGIAAGLAIALARTDVPTVINPPLTPITPEYGDRG